MKKKIIRRTPEEAFDHWVKALESGDYFQTANALKKIFLPESINPIIGFCCLGVVCDLASKDGGPQWDTVGKAKSFSFMDDDIMLPKEVREFLGITNDEEAELMGMNDDGTSFPDIAKHIKTKIMPAALKRLAKSEKF